MSRSQSLERGLDALELIHRSGRPMGIRELARELELTPAIVQRLLNSLLAKHYVRKDDVTRKYSIGYQSMIFGGTLMRTDALLLEARHELEEVTRKLKIDTFMGTLQGRNSFYLLCIPGGGPISVRCEPGEPVRLHSTAIGKCILASYSDAEAMDIIGPGPLERVTSKTITDAERLLEDVRLTRERGWALVRDENIEGIISVGAFVGERGRSGRAAISLSFSPFFSKDTDLDEAVAVITAAARRINRNIGVN